MSSGTINLSWVILASTDISYALDHVLIAHWLLVSLVPLLLVLFQVDPTL